MEKYEKYKDSGIEWIGEIPEHWDVKRIKRLSTVKRGASPRPIADQKYFDINGEWAWVRIADVSASERYLEKTTQTLSELGSSLSVKMMPNSIFLSIAGTVGKPIITKIKCCIHDGFVYFPELKLNPEFIYFIFTTGQLYKGLGKLGTQLNLNTDTVGEIYLPIPNSNEINTIANYLDHKTTEIDELIADKKRLLELYEEEKTAIINQAVTKGINPNVPMKDSGIEWLGKIPEHWEVLPIKYTLSTPITDGPHETPELLPDGIPFISAEAIKNDKIDFSKKRGFISREEHERFSLKYKPQVGDVYMIKSGATTGNLAIVETDIEFNIWSPLAAMRPNFDVLLSEFLFYFMKSKSFFSAIEIGWNYGTQQNIGMKVLENIRMVLPSTNEQKEIVEHIKIHMVQIDSQIDKINRLIDLLTEYRTALISEVVTGKIKVTE